MLLHLAVTASILFYKAAFFPLLLAFLSALSLTFSGWSSDYCNKAEGAGPCRVRKAVATPLFVCKSLLASGKRASFSAWAAALSSVPWATTLPALPHSLSGPPAA